MMLLVSGNLIACPVQANEALFRLLQERNCSGCRLADADLVHADLRDADLSNAKLMRANLGQAQLDGANLSGADLSFTSLRGASLRGADLRGTRLYGTDLREADLTGAQLQNDALAESHWKGARGITAGIRSHAQLHNAGVEAFQAGQWLVAERLFSKAIINQPKEPMSWVARGISRSEQAKDDLAGSDFRYAASIYKTQGLDEWADKLNIAADSISQRRYKNNSPKEGPAIGGQLLEGTIKGLRMIAPIALKALVPLGLAF